TPQHVERFLAAPGHRHVVALDAQHAGAALAQRALVVGDENTDAGLGGRLDGNELRERTGRCRRCRMCNRQGTLGKPRHRSLRELCVAAAANSMRCKNRTRASLIWTGATANTSMVSVAAGGASHDSCAFRADGRRRSLTTILYQ